MRWEYSLSILFLKAFSDDAQTTLSGSEFHAFVTLLEKKYLYLFVLGLILVSMSRRYFNYPPSPGPDRVIKPHLLSVTEGIKGAFFALGKRPLRP